MSDRPILTALQQGVHSCILAYFDRNGISPTTVEIRAITGYSDREVIRARNELFQIFSAEYVGHLAEVKRLVSHHNCPSCGGEIQASFAYCPSCGLALQRDAA